MIIIVIIVVINESYTIGLIYIKQSVTNLILLYAVDHIITRFQQK